MLQRDRPFGRSQKIGRSHHRHRPGRDDFSRRSRDGDGAGAGRAQPATGSSATIAEFCSTDSGSLFHRHAQLAAANQAEDAQRNVEQALQKAVQHSHDLTTIIRFNSRNDVV